MLTLVMRHLESRKNISKTFSSFDDHEELTSDGERLGQDIANNISSFIRTQGLIVRHIYCANSERAFSTAKYIADKIQVDVLTFNDLRSNNSGALLGKSESEAAAINPSFIKQLKLFRAGLYSSYNFVKVAEREDKRDFERRIISCLTTILEDNSEDLKIIVLHHSSLTATMIHIARQFYGYPDDFYGHVACELGNLYLWNSNEILLCNEPSDELIGLNIQRSDK